MSELQLALVLLAIVGVMALMAGAAVAVQVVADFFGDWLRGE